MNKNILCWIFFLVYTPLIAQEYNSSTIFAHNDYVQPIPFHNAYQHQVGYIEADVFLEKQNLFVAHTHPEIKEENTLEELYLKPLQKKLLRNKIFAYADTSKHLVLMIDLKTEAEPTLKLLVKQLRKYPELIASPTFKIAISGNMPEPAAWENYPDYIHFDGRPGIDYTADQLRRVAMISTSFRDYSRWNGKGVLTSADKQKVQAVIDTAHAKGKKIRFWASPDFNNAWMIFMQMGLDILNSDDVNGLAAYLKALPHTTFRNNSFHSVYQPAQPEVGISTRPKNIILMIGDGMGLTQLYSAYTANQGKLNIFQIKDIGFSVTTASDSDITDSAAGATAMASGHKTNNRHVGVDSEGIALVPLTARLKQGGYNTAVISNGDVTDATPAAFYAHNPERSASEAIALDLLDSNLDILIGGGSKSFTNRSDGRNLMNELEEAGYSVFPSLRAIDTVRTTKFVLIDDKAALSKKEGRGDFLTTALQQTSTLLARDAAPFFITLEGAQIDWGGHANELEYVVRETLDFDQAVAAAMRFADQNKETLLIVTADHETGGLSLLGGDTKKGYVQGNFSTTDHSGVMVPVFSYGPGSNLFKGVYQNTDIHHKILEVLGWVE